MKFWASTEAYQPAYPTLDLVRRMVEVYLNREFGTPSFADWDCKLRYVPIVMPEDMRENYPARSKLRIKSRIVVCAPQLNYEVFVVGTLKEQLQEYLCGIATSAPFLAKLGATNAQISEFEAILSGATERILLERPDQIRH